LAAPGERGLGAHPLGGAPRALEAAAEDRPGGAGGVGPGVGVLQLPEDLRLADHQRVERRRHPEHVIDRRRADVLVQRAPDLGRRRAAPRQERPLDLGHRARALGRGRRAVDLDPVAGRDQHRLGDAAGVAHVAQHVAELVLGEREVLAHRHRRGPPRQPDHEQLGAHAPTARRTK
jgi:hypothetical protein